jgi:hypothetical protein
VELARNMRMMMLCGLVFIFRCSEDEKDSRRIRVLRVSP